MTNLVYGRTTKMKSTTAAPFFLLSLLLRISASSPPPLLPKEALPTRSGYLPVNPATGSSIYYTLYEAQTPTTPLNQTPLVIWLQGGPGCSSMIGNFLELGPWRVKQHLGGVKVEPNPGSWNRIFGLLFLDNPIGTGFSIAASDEEIPRDQYSVAKHLFTAITGFLDLDPIYKNRPIYITGESYAGKYVPAIGYYILKKNLSKRVNLQGVAIGNGLTDPVTQVATHAVNTYYSGLVNEKQKSELEKAQLEAIKLVKMGSWSEATNARREVLKMLQTMTGLATLYDFSKRVPYQTILVTKLLRIDEVKRALGANESIVFDECSDVVGGALDADVMKSVKYMVEFLVQNTKVLLYQGHFDLRDGVVSTEAWMKTMEWQGIDKFLMAERKVWQVNGVLAGYVQKWANLSHVIVLGAGHFVPTDQPLNSQAMIEDWVLDKGLFTNDQEETLPCSPHFKF
ncbi:hypothetical protein Ddye_030374 [Dipteronia dyeriana]|uniref:Carboxypeptidase n=1 Tax=Dipteronia dyeriana TaxID=168575 RepID=A0AAD9WMG5_9ROSI|nr:hypothetical protein Ddye_030374 [Dipteronia dyeriana]